MIANLKIEITSGFFYNTLHPTASPSRVIRVGDIFEVDSIGPNGHAKYRARYGGVMRDISLDGKYWSFADDGVKDSKNDVACTCDIISLMSVGCKCGWIQVERGEK